MSPFWKETYQRFYDSDRKQLVLRVGRRGGKSSNLCMLAVATALAGDYKIPATDVGVISIVSATKADASARIRTIGQILKAIGVPHKQLKDSIDLPSRRVVIKVFAATIAGVVGFTSILCICDEISRWRDDNAGGANPAREVLASLRPTMATQPTARIVLSSSPFSTNDEHYRAFEEGDDEYQLTAFAPTWIANPNITEEASHRLEKDRRIWLREYAAIVQAAELSAFDVDAVDRAFEVKPPANGVRGERILVIDPSSGKKDTWSYAVVGWSLGQDPYIRDVEGNIRRTPWGEPMRRAESSLVPPVLCFDEVGAFAEGSFWEQTNAAAILDKIVATARAHGCKAVHSDQREAFLLRNEIERRGLRFYEHAWSSPSKITAVEAIRRWLADGKLSLPAHEKLRAELYAFEERSTPSGALTFAARGRGHDDFVSLLLTTAMAESEGLISSSPNRKPQPFRGMVTTRCGLAF